MIAKLPKKTSEASHSSSIKRIAVVFPGQGSQSAGMMTELAAEYPIVEETFAEASRALGFDLWAVCQDEERLGLTEFTQPALLAASIAVWRIIKEDIIDDIVCIAGHSLGEYSALCAADVLKFPEAIRIVHERGKLMQQAVEGLDIKMAAVLGLDNDQVVSICEQASETDDDAIVSVANFNSPSQVVVAGNAIGVEAVSQHVQMMGKRAIALKVSVPSHCALMQPACESLDKMLNIKMFNAPNIPVIQNLNAKEEKTTTAIKEAVTSQLCEPVKWAQTMQLLASRHINMIIECGAGTVLSNLAKRQATPIVSYPTDKPVRLEKLREALN